MDCPFLVFMENNSYRLMVPDFQHFSVCAQTLDQAIELAQQALVAKIRELKAHQQVLPTLSRREDYIHRHLDAILVSTLTLNLETL